MCFMMTSMPPLLVTATLHGGQVHSLGKHAYTCGERLEDPSRQSDGVMKGAACDVQYCQHLFGAQTGGSVVSSGCMRTLSNIVPAAGRMEGRRSIACSIDMSGTLSRRVRCRRITHVSYAATRSSATWPRDTITREVGNEITALEYAQTYMNKENATTKRKLKDLLMMKERTSAREMLERKSGRATMVVR